MKKQIIMARVLEFGGNNTYLKTLIRYFGEENIILLIKRKEEQIYVSRIDPAGKIQVIYLPGLRVSVNFKKNALWYNLKELYYLLNIFRRIVLLSAKNGFAGLTISAIDPEQYLYFLWMPFIKLTYVLHSEPLTPANHFTTLTCNTKLSRRKRIITVSKANKSCIVAQWKIMERKAAFVEVVYNCVNKNTQNDRGFSLNENMQMILTMGHVDEYKNPQLWLQVARLVLAVQKNSLFYWLGNGHQLAQYQQAVKPGENIYFTGLIDNPSSYLSNASVYYQPSLIETQGIAVLEAMSYKIPCIVSDAGGLPESVENDKSGYVIKTNDANEHATKIINLLERKDLGKIFGENGYKRYIDLFTFESFKKQMDEIFA